MFYIRWAGTKEFFFPTRPYKDKFLKVVKTTFIKLTYTMTPILRYTFQMVNSFPNFFFA